jgi:hypothetical protein
LVLIDVDEIVGAVVDDRRWRDCCGFMIDVNVVVVAGVAAVVAVGCCTQPRVPFFLLILDAHMCLSRDAHVYMPLLLLHIPLSIPLSLPLGPIPLCIPLCMTVADRDRQTRGSRGLIEIDKRVSL